MQIKTIPMWTGMSDNYAYLIVDDKTKDAMVIDPANPLEVLPILRKQLQDKSINLTGIINTHHHRDHSGGNQALLEEFPAVPVLGGGKCPHVSKILSDGEEFKIGEAIDVKAMHTPCHTQDSICYYVQDGDDRAVFTGDTLFIGGCGRFFEGSAAEMNAALNGILAALPDDTKVYPGHEYTKSNIKFGLSVLENEPMINLARFCEENSETQGKFTIGDEKKHNVFMRLDDPVVQEATGEKDPIRILAALREMKNGFR